MKEFLTKDQKRSIIEGKRKGLTDLQLQNLKKGLDGFSKYYLEREKYLAESIIVNEIENIPIVVCNEFVEGTIAVPSHIPTACVIPLITGEILIVLNEALKKEKESGNLLGYMGILYHELGHVKAGHVKFNIKEAGKVILNEAYEMEADLYAFEKGFGKALSKMLKKLKKLLPVDNRMLDNRIKRLGELLEGRG